MKIGVAIPAMLAVSIGQTSVTVEATTVADALRALAAHPRLGPLVCDESGRLRRHVLLFHNDTATRHLPTADVPLSPGDRLTIVQAVSGG